MFSCSLRDGGMPRVARRGGLPWVGGVRTMAAPWPTGSGLHTLPPSEQSGIPGGTLRVAVDGSALFSARDGIGRYLTSLLGRCVAMAPDAWDWTVLGRRARLPADLPGLAEQPARNLQVLGDGLPVDAGRILSLATSQPRWIVRLRPDLFWGPAHRLPWGLPASMARVLTVHDLCWLRAPETMRTVSRWLDRGLMPRAIREADRIIAVSGATRDDLVSAFPAAAERVVVVAEAAESLPMPGPASALSQWDVRAPYVLFVGSAEPRKNLPRLIEAFSRLPSGLRERHHLVLAGGAGWGGVDPARLAHDLGIGERLRCLGRVDDAALATLYRHARCLALPSLYEGFGLPVLEALSQGTPVLVSDRASLPEVAGEAGLRVDPLDPAAIAEGLAVLLADDAVHGRLAAAAPGQAAKFSWENAARETLRVFGEALARRRLVAGR